MTDLLCIDPGNTTGWAWFVNGKLYWSNYAEYDFILEHPPGCALREVVIEKPQWRPHEKKIDVNDLIKLAIMVGELKRHYELTGKLLNTKVELVVPTTWKGSVPKEIHNERVLKHLTVEELARVPLRPRAKTPDNNCVDAVGIGLWKLGRLR